MSYEHLFRAGSTYLSPPKPVSEAELAQFETSRGVKLPASYVRLLRLQNGGRVRKELFLTPDDQDYHIEEIAGIGEGRSSSLNLLQRYPVEDEAGRDVSDLVIPFGRLTGYGFLALDYRECGAHGEPSVLAVDTVEPPPILETVAEDFETFVGGLQRADSEYFFGFLGETELPKLIARLEKVLRCAVDSCSPPEMPAYHFRPHFFTAKDRLSLVPNTDYATHYDGENFFARPAGLEFPDFPECEWMLKCSAHFDEAEQLFKHLERAGLEVVVMHEPQPQLELELSRDLPPAPAAADDSFHVQEVEDFRMEIAARFGKLMIANFTSVADRTVCHLFSGDDIRIVTTPHELLVNELNFGPLAPGDSVRIVDVDAVFVNGVKREGQIRRREDETGIWRRL